MSPLFDLLVPVIGIVVLLVFIGLVLARLYKRATREISLVRTGSGGKRVIMDGGAIVIPLLHEISAVNMKTLRLEVKREGEAALITQDRMRVDVGVEFYVSVEATDEGVARAAQTLGDRTFDVDQLREMIEGKLIDGLRAVAAQMTMDGLHENRADFVQQVQNAVAEDLLKNGLALESVSLTALDQTPFEKLDENNAFNAVGMRQLAEVIADSKKKRAQIEADAEVAVQRTKLEAEKEAINIARDEEAARLAQAQEIETLRAAQETEIAQRRADAERISEEARIAKERSVRGAEIAREEQISAAEIAKDRAVREAEIAREQAVRAAEISTEREIEVADQERQIIIAQKSEEESRARASADTARAEAAKAEEAIATTRQVAEAERKKSIALIEAAQEAERMATKVRLEAEAEKQAAADRAEAIREAAQGESDAITIRAEAKKKDLLAEAEGKRAITDAENALSRELIDMKVAMARLDAAPRIVAEMVRPAEKIDSIRINHVSGLGAGAGGGAEGAAAPATPVGEAINAMLGMAVQMPALKKLGAQVGMSFDDLTAEEAQAEGETPADDMPKAAE